MLYCGKMSIRTSTARTIILASGMVVAAVAGAIGYDQYNKSKQIPVAAPVPKIEIQLPPDTKPKCDGSNINITVIDKTGKLEAFAPAMKDAFDIKGLERGCPINFNGIFIEGGLPEPEHKAPKEPKKQEHKAAPPVHRAPANVQPKAGAPVPPPPPNTPPPASWVPQPQPQPRALVPAATAPVLAVVPGPAYPTNCDIEPNPWTGQPMEFCNGEPVIFLGVTYRRFGFHDVRREEGREYHSYEGRVRTEARTDLHIESRAAPQGHIAQTAAAARRADPPARMQAAAPQTHAAAPIRVFAGKR